MKVRIEGIAPLIMHNGLLADPEYHFTKEKKKITAKRKKVEADQEEISRLEFLGSLYTDSTGKIIVPARVLLGAIIKGAKGLKEGPAAKAGVFVDADVPLIYDGPTDPEALYAATSEDGKGRPFVLRVPVKQGTASVIRVRPIFPKWAVEFDLTIMDDVTNAQTVRQMLDHSGRMCGLGDWRPQYGRFKVVQFGEPEAGDWRTMSMTERGQFIKQHGMEKANELARKSGFGGAMDKN